MYAPHWKGAQAHDEAVGYRVVRHPGTLMLPGPAVDARMRRSTERATGSIDHPTS
ncbi:hypothetical protein MAHJHV54_47430 [Mycobacterium avium subsp. hominissuis]